MNYNIKDIIRINQEIGETGHILNKSGLDFALDRINKEKSWLRQAALLIRAIISDRAFEDGNKRTAYTLFAAIAEEERKEYEPTKLVKIIHTISRKNVVDIGKIERMLKNAAKRKED
jgi:prophage maintenance system killer protein